MCGRFTITKPENVKEMFNAANKMPLFDKSYNVAPSQNIPTITKNSPNRIILMKWGLKFRKTSKASPINIRKDTLDEKPFYTNFLINRRCIIPADGFYEWLRIDLEGKEEKFPFYFYLKNKRLFGFAGIYSKISDAEGKPQYSFAIITCSPNNSVAKIHDRMPVVLTKANEDKWLNSDKKDKSKLLDILTPLPDNLLKYHPVSRRVNNPRNDDEEIIEKKEYVELSRLKL